jgi:predicted enzyme related to lactoylglutathione lyase
MVHVLSSRILLHPVDPERSRRFYGEQLGLSVYREFGTGPERGTVYFLGGGFLEVSGRAPAGQLAGASIRLWMQVRDVAAEHRRLLDAGVTITREPVREPWGLVEMWLEDPDGVAIVLVEVPADHPLRRDTRDGGE